jgi:hypothetical protein
MIKPQAQGFLFRFNSEVYGLSRGQENKGENSDSETPRRVEY